MAIDYMAELNDSQYKAVVCMDRPLLVIAGAGSGKTRVLTYKIAYLLEHERINPKQILVLTFTNKAANEMWSRVRQLIGIEEVSHLWMGTFHSVFSYILRLEAERLGFSSSYTVYDQADSRNLLKTLIREMGLDEKLYKPAIVQNHISLAKNRLISPEAYIDETARMPRIGEIYQRYCQRCRLSNAMDFDDLLYNTYALFKEYPDVCSRYAERFHYVLVDEYQDTNYAQHEIVWLLTKERQRLCAVGDDAQSIYSFRGAEIDNMLNFSKRYDNPQVLVLSLDENYRSKEQIVFAANSLIEHNTKRIHKQGIICPRGKGERLQVYEAYSDLEEANIVVNKMMNLHVQQCVAYDDMAVLYRTNGQSRTFEEALLKQSIPYRVYGGLSFYQRKEIKDAIAYFRLAMNPNDEEAFKRVVNYPPRGIGKTTLEKLGQVASINNISLWTVACKPKDFGLNLNKGTLEKLKAFCALIKGFHNDVLTVGAEDLAEHILKESGMIHDIYQSHEPEDLSRQENIQELMNGLVEFAMAYKEEGRGELASLEDFLQVVSLMSDLDEDKGNEESKVTLMTIHSAKGLEFSVVFVVGLEEGLFPSLMSGENEKAIEEERRLCYVAITRAEDWCFLTYAHSRYRYGKTEICIPSRFLREIDPIYLDMHTSSSLGSSITTGFRPSFSWKSGVGSRMDDYETGSPARRVASVSGLKRLSLSPRPEPSSASRPSSSVPGGNARVEVGQTIEHERFGIGRVLQVEGTGENVKATVEFRHSGIKQLLLRFARFKIIG